jgi:Cu(I)/Ag(I) efflux system membrane fusion protein
MVPGQRFDKPGKSPFMNMMLEPVYADSGTDEGTVAVSPRMRQSLGIRTAEAVRGTIAPPLSAVGSVAYNERDQAVVQARANGFVERLFVRAALDPVREGQPLAELYVPDWVAAQEEFLAVRRMRGPGIEVLADGARQRMRLAGMNDAQIALVESSGSLQPRLTLTAPIGGVVTELSVREGTTVAMGAPLFRINGLATVWVNAEVPESTSALVRVGTPVEVRSPALPGTMRRGRVAALLPDLNQATRTLKVRIETANPGQALVPGVFVTVDFQPVAREGVLVPSEAIVATGRRTVVFVAESEGRYGAVNVETGNEMNGMTEITRGLEPGQKVVVSGQFLIDSDASLKGTLTRAADPADTAAQPPSASAAKAMPGPSATAMAMPALPPGVHRGEGRVETIAKDELMLSHGPIPSLKWGPMTMGFMPPANGLPDGLAVGDRITFTFRARGAGEYEVLSIARLPGTARSSASGPVRDGARP